MHARLPLLLAALAGSVAVPMAVLVEEPRAPAAPRGALLEAAPRPAGQAFAIETPARAIAAPLAHHVLPTDTSLADLHEALRAAYERIDLLNQTLRTRDELWEARLERSRLEDDLHVMLQREFPEIVAQQDPNAEDSTEDEIVGLLLAVAEWIGPETVETDDGEIAGPRTIVLADLRSFVGDSMVRRLAQRLPAWNLQRALTPYPGSWCALGEEGTRSGCVLYDMREVDGEAVPVGSVRVEHDDPRVGAAIGAYEAVSWRRARDLEAVLGLPAGVLE
jgi:hypothetical protein